MVTGKAEPLARVGFTISRGDRRDLSSETLGALRRAQDVSCSVWSTAEKSLENDLDDLELQQLRDQLYGLAEVITDKITNCSTDGAAQQESHPNHKDGFKTALRILDETEREEAQERAAIIEFDGGGSRDEAERKAVLIAIQKRNEKK